MIGWELKYSESYSTSHTQTRIDKMIKDANEVMYPCMEYFCKRLSETERWTIDDAKMIFGEIIDEMPILSYRIWNGEFTIIYNRYIDVKLTDSVQQIYREQKLNKIL